MKYVYERYQRDREDIVEKVIRYRQRREIRDVGKEMGMREEVKEEIENKVWGIQGGGIERKNIRKEGIEKENKIIKREVEMEIKMIGFKRKMQKNVGGLVIKRERMEEKVKIGKEEMEKRYLIEWEKEDIDEVGLMKVDVMQIGMIK